MVIAWGRFQKFRQEQRELKEKERVMEIERIVRLWFPHLDNDEREGLVLHLKDGGSYPEWREGQPHTNGTH